LGYIIGFSTGSLNAVPIGGDHLEDEKTLLTAREAAEYLRISLFTLRKIEQQDLIVPYRTPGGHRRYSIEMLNDYLEKSRQPPP
jgi:excisionase family DNA binding protein